MEIPSPKSSIPAITAKTDSKESTRDATVGSVFFWAAICKVYATPPEKNPEYKRGKMQRMIFFQSPISKAIAQGVDKRATTKNCMQDIFRLLVLGEK